MTKKLNVEGITNELKEQSAFFKQHSPLPTAAPGETQSSHPTPPPAVKHPLEASVVAQEGPKDQKPSPSPPPPPEPITEPMNERTFVRPSEHPVVRSKERKKLRHSFDIYADQLLALREITLQREILSGERVLLGDLVQEAFDLFIKHERKNEGTNEHLNV